MKLTRLTMWFPCLAILPLLLATAEAPTSRPAVIVPDPASGLRPQSLEPPLSEVVAGSKAPAFSWQDERYRWMRLNDLLAHSNVLLVFAPTTDQMKQLQQDRNRMVEAGVVPVIVIQHRSGAVWPLARELQLTYVVVPDPRGVIATQYNLMDPVTRTIAPGWFAIDRKGQVRGLDRGNQPERPWLRLATDALGLPAPQEPRPAVAH